MPTDDTQTVIQRPPADAALAETSDLAEGSAPPARLRADNDKPATVPQRSLVKPARRRILLTILAVTVGFATVGSTGFWLLISRGHVVTDNAYVGADVAQITPLDAGTVRQVLVRETETVRAGQILVILDDADAKVALAAAEAVLASAERKVVGYHATDRSLAAQTAARDADRSRSRAVLAATSAARDKARLDLERRRALFARGFASAEQLTDLESAFAVAQANYEAAQAGQIQAGANLDVAVGAFDANLALTKGAPLQDNPEIRAARARADQARLQLERTIVRAPVAGVIARRDVQIGQRVAAGERMMQVAPLDQAYVDANYKESQLRNVRPGQPVLLTADLYGRSVPYHGRVLGLSGGTGSVFAVIPTQNATGNWIKVVQRLSVRIALDPAELKAKPLRLGLSMRADIDTHAPRAR